MYSDQNPLIDINNAIYSLCTKLKPNIILSHYYYFIFILSLLSMSTFRKPNYFTIYFFQEPTLATNTSLRLHVNSLVIYKASFIMFNELKLQLNRTGPMLPKEDLSIQKELYDHLFLSCFWNLISCSIQMNISPN